MVRNRLGLDRFIPAATRRAVRQRCGFGCVVCGCAIIQYHHFDPPFALAQSHEESGITLLCGQCHDRASRGIISELQVRKANSSPYCRASGHAKDILFLSNSKIPVRFGSSRVCAETIIKYDDDIVVGLSRPDDSNAPLLLNATLTDENGEDLLCIANNEWQVGVNRYDVQTTKDRLQVNDRSGHIVLEMSLATVNELSIERLKMFYRGFQIEANKDFFALTVPSGPTIRHNGSIYADVGIWLKSSGEALIAVNSNGGTAISTG